MKQSRRLGLFGRVLALAVLLTTLAQAGAARAQAAEAHAGPEVVGLRLGMNADAAMAVLKAYLAEGAETQGDPGIRVQNSTLTLKGLSVRFVSQVDAHSPIRNESFVLNFVPESTPDLKPDTEIPSRLSRVSRYLGLRPMPSAKPVVNEAKPVDRADVLADLTARFGPPSYPASVAAVMEHGASMIAWRYRTDKSVITPQNATAQEKGCTQFSVPLRREASGEVTSPCYAQLVVNLSGDADPHGFIRESEISTVMDSQAVENEGARATQAIAQQLMATWTARANEKRSTAAGGSGVKF